MTQTNFIFGVHNHQPVGNLDFVFRKAFDLSYKPFLDALELHPAIKLSIHVSGPLIEWLEENEKSYLDRIAVLAERDQLEILSGGFYEPILAAIPDHDKLGQIQKLNAYIEQRFGQKPAGLWLTERVWEPHLAKPISEAGISYIAVDDYHFLGAGVPAGDLDGYFLTEEQNAPLGLFPISQTLRYAMPFKEPEVTINHIKERGQISPEALVVMADDGEKFGLWPGTNRHCYGKSKWLNRFFSALEENSDWLQTLTFKEAFHNSRPKGRIYLPSMSYFEMSQWSLPAQAGSRLRDFIKELENGDHLDSVRPFIRGGNWRNFLAKYAESNWMQKRVYQASLKYQAAVGNGATEGLEQAQTAIWRSQCNCAYWHGIFGGLYLPHLRNAVWENLLEAENLLSGQVNGTEIGFADVNLDGLEDVEINTGAIKAFMTPIGGAIRELDIKSACFNIVNSIARYEESYHDKLADAVVGDYSSGSIHEAVVAKEPDLDRFVGGDQHAHHSLVDHFYSGIPAAKALHVGQARDLGNLADQLFSITQVSDKLEVAGEGTVAGTAVSIKKLVSAENNRLDMEISVTNRGKGILEVVYAPEFNFSLLGGHTKDRYYLIDGRKPRAAYLDSIRDIKGAQTITLVSEWERVRADLIFPEATPALCYPIFTVSLSEEGFEKVYQSSVVHPVFPLKLAPNTTFQTVISLEVSKYESSD